MLTNRSVIRLGTRLVAISLATAPPIAYSQDAAPTDLVGLWKAKRCFGPDVKGKLVIHRAEGEWRASIAGRSVAVRMGNDTMSFVLLDGGGSFVGRFSARRSTIVGHWIQPRTVTDGNTFASPVVLSGCGTNCFTGNVAPRDEEFTFYITDFYPRGRPTGSYSYSPPRQRDDGWPTGTLEEAGLSREKIWEFMQALINTPIDSVGSPEVHGMDCDDASETSPGSEEAITQQDDNPDWYRIILDLGMIRDPGAKAVYCSINPHLAGGVLSRVTGRSLSDLMRELVAEPLQMQHYYVALTPLGEGYMGGGWRFRPRDFMKLGQLHLNGGTWRGKRVVSEDWVRRSTSPRYDLGRIMKYGYLWWVREYPHSGRTLQTYNALGNGGQTIMVILELDLVFVAYDGNYSDSEATWKTQRDLVPRFVLPAILSSSRR